MSEAYYILINEKLGSRNYDMFLSRLFLRLTRQEIGIRCIAAELDERIRAVVRVGGDDHLGSVYLQGDHDHATVKRSWLRKVDQ